MMKQYKLIYYIPLKIDMYQLEDCIKSILTLHDIKINTCANIIVNHIL